MTGDEICVVCGKPGATVYRWIGERGEYVHAHCDRARETSPSEARQEWSINAWLMRG
jgi:hypothetical protein